MIINAVIESKDGGTLVLDFPRSIYDVYEKLQSVGIRQSKCAKRQRRRPHTEQFLSLISSPTA